MASTPFVHYGKNKLRYVRKDSASSIEMGDPRERYNISIQFCQLITAPFNSTKSKDLQTSSKIFDGYIENVKSDL
jgi:hypothetical protein